MDYDEIMGARLSVLESRIAAMEQQLFVLLQGGTALQKRRKRDLTPEERTAIRARLVLGQQKKRLEREAQIVAEAAAPTKKARNSKKEEAAS